MLPAKFVERVLRELGPDEGGALCRALTGEPSVSVRLNAAKGLAAPSGRFAEGMNLVTADGAALGFAKRIGRRCNNLYPNSLRILKG